MIEREYIFQSCFKKEIFDRQHRPFYSVDPRPNTLDRPTDSAFITGTILS